MPKTLKNVKNFNKIPKKTKNMIKFPRNKKMMSLSHY